LLRNYDRFGIFNDKPKLLALIASVVTSILSIPVLMPHATHPHMIFHIIVHLASLIFAQFLALVSLIAYFRTRSIKILFMTLGFMTLVVVEYLYLFYATENIYGVFIPIVNIELSHVILLVMVTFFGISFLKGGPK
jgi:hypothetical protein